MESVGAVKSAGDPSVAAQLGERARSETAEPGVGRHGIVSGGASSEPAFPLLQPSPDGPAERYASALGDRHPVLVFLAALLPGFGLLVGISCAFGLLVIQGLVPIDPIGDADERVVAWLVDRRSNATVDASWVGSTIAGGAVIPAVIGLVLVVSVVKRWWSVGAFVLFAVAVESGTYRSTTLLLHRERPDVDRLESLPVNASYPSGHTAASIALYCGIALLLTSRIRNSAARIAIWCVALAIPLFVAMSRMLRGMHHPLDVAGGLVIGILAVVVVCFAVRAAVAAAEHRRAPATPEGSS
jgi:undecaprenyl-diphosphatase